MDKSNAPYKTIEGDLLPRRVPEVERYLCALEREIELQTEHLTALLDLARRYRGKACTPSAVQLRDLALEVAGADSGDTVLELLGGGDGPPTWWPADTPWDDRRGGS